MSQRTEVIETTVGEVAAELAPGRREARLRVIAAGLSDEDIDWLIKQAQYEAEPAAG